MPEHHNFFANGILAHNCHMIDIDDACSDDPQSQYGKIIKHFRSINPMLAIIGLTGSPFRGTTPIISAFWRKIIEPQIDMKWLVERGFIVPTVFGYSGLEYDLNKFDQFQAEGTTDFSSSQLAEMADCMELSTTQQIMREVMEITSDRLGVLITCASLKHCKEAASALPDGSYGIVTDKTPSKERIKILDDAKSLKIKYVLQIGCLTTGVDVPVWCTSVILRRIGSLTLLTQLLGRGMRLLKPEHEAAGYHKTDHLCLDYSGTMHSMAQLFDNPMLEAAELSHSKKNGETKQCPSCGTENSEYARRCIGGSFASKDGRCEHFWQSQTCEKCKTLNDVAARECRECKHQLIDPNKQLANTHYRDSDWKKVISFDVSPTPNGGVLVSYGLQNEEDLTTETAKLYYNPWSSDGAKRIWQQQFVYRHITSWPWRKKVDGMRTAEAVCRMKALFDVPTHATHRVNEKGRSIVHGLQFNTRKLSGSKVVA